MTIAETIKDRFTNEYDRGDTQQEIADRHHICQQYFNQLKSGRSRYENISVGKLQEMFPQAVILLDGPKAETHGDHSPAFSAAHDNNFFQSDFSDAIKKVMASDDLSSDEKVKFFEVLTK